MSAVLRLQSSYFINKLAHKFGFYNSCNCITEIFNILCWNRRISKQDIKGISDVITLKILIHLLIFMGFKFSLEILHFYSVFLKKKHSNYISSIWFKLSSWFQFYLSYEPTTITTNWQKANLYTYPLCSSSSCSWDIVKYVDSEVSRCISHIKFRLCICSL
jgi:hypothetical protein